MMKLKNKKAGKKDARVKDKDARKGVGAKMRVCTNLLLCLFSPGVHAFSFASFFPAFSFACSHFNAAPPSP
jgi:hypothetical protein